MISTFNACDSKAPKNPNPCHVNLQEKDE
jgi:hypothetical protein